MPTTRHPQHTKPIDDADTNTAQESRALVENTAQAEPDSSEQTDLVATLPLGLRRTLAAAPRQFLSKEWAHKLNAN